MKYFRYFPIFFILYEFASYLSNDMYLPAFTILGGDFSVTDEQVQLTMTAWLVGNALFQLLIGPFADHYGRRTILLWGGLMFVGSSLLCRYTKSFEIFLMLRCLQGIGVSTMMIPGYATIHDLYSDREAVRLIALMGCFAVLAPMIAPILGSLVLSFSTWRTIFDIVGGLSLIALAGLYFIMPESLKRPILPLRIASIAKNYAKILGQRSFLATTLALGFMYGGVIVWIAEGPFLLMRHFDLNEMEFSFAQIPIFSAYILGAQAVRFFMDRVNPCHWVWGGLSAGLISLSILWAVVIWNRPSLTVLLLLMSLFTFSFGLVYAPLCRVAMTSTELQKGAVSSAFYFLMTLCGITGTLLIALMGGGGFLGFASLMWIMSFGALVFYRIRQK